MARKILRSEAPQNDRGGGRARHRMAAFRPLSFCTSTPPVILSPPIVILSEAKNLFSCLKDMA